MSTPATGDLPDWSVLVNPNIKSASLVDQGAGVVTALFQSATPYRIWAAWLDISAFTSGSFALGASAWGARIGDGAGNALIKVITYFGAASQILSKALALPIAGYTPVVSGGNYTTNFITDVGFANMFTRASGGILYSQP